MDTPPLGPGSSSAGLADLASAREELPPGGLPDPGAEAASRREVERQHQVLDELMDEGAEAVAALVGNALAAPVNAVTQPGLMLVDTARRARWYAAVATTEIENSLGRLSAIAQLPGSPLPMLAQRTPPARPEALSDLYRRLDEAERAGGQGESPLEIVASELPLIGIPYALRNLARACLQGDSTDCAGALGSVLGGTFALGALQAKPWRTLPQVARRASTLVEALWREDAASRVVSGPSGARHPVLVRLEAGLDLPLDAPMPPAPYSPGYVELLGRVTEAPALRADTALGRLLGEGDFKRVYEFEPEPAWVIKVPKAGEAAPTLGSIRPEQLLPIANEVVTAERLAGIGIRSNTAHGLIRLEFSHGVQGVAYVADAIPGAILLKHDLVFPLMRNIKIGMPLDWNIQPRVLAGLRELTLDSFDHLHTVRAERGFRILHEQPLLDPTTGLLVQQDAQGIVGIGDIYGMADLRRSVQVRNWVAELLGRPQVAVPTVRTTPFTPWW